MRKGDSGFQDWPHRGGLEEAVVLRRWSLALVLHPQAVVEAAEATAVVLDGQPAFASGQDVVDVAALRGHVAARGVRAVAVTHLDGPPQRAPEEPPAHAHVDDP